MRYCLGLILIAACAGLNDGENHSEPFKGANGVDGKNPPPVVVFVCDASESMLQKFDPVRVELRKAINGLKPQQKFDIIFMGEHDPISLDKTVLAAGADEKRRALDFLERVTPKGPTDPLPALKLAFSMKPALVFLLTDGDFPDNKAVIDLCHNLNKDKAAKINTDAFLDRGEEYEKTLKEIAADSGGTYSYICEEDLDQ